MNEQEITWIEMEDRGKKHPLWVRLAGATDDGHVWCPIQVGGPYTFILAAWAGEPIVQYRSIEFVDIDWLIRCNSNDSEEVSFLSEYKQKILFQFRKSGN